MCVSRSAPYIELTENWPSNFNDHLNMSSQSFKCTCAILITRLCHDYKFASTKLLMNEIFNGIVLKTLATVSSFLQTI
jgi:hypothetical protein